MKWIPNKTFPYPVLVSDNVASSDRDYIGGEFCVETDDMDIEPATQAVNLVVKCRLNQPSLKRLIDEGKAKYAVGVHCRKTYLRRLKISDNAEIRINFPKGDLDDRVDISAYVVCHESITEYTSKEFHEEFGERLFSIDAGSALAVTRPFGYLVNLSPLKALGSIFELVPEDSVNGYKVNWESANIGIMMNTKEAAVFKNWQDSQRMWPSMLASVYLCTLVETLHLMLENSEEYSNKKWFEVIKKTATEKGIDMKPNMDCLEAAQKLLDFPVSVMISNEGDE